MSEYEQPLGDILDRALTARGIEEPIIAWQTQPGVVLLIATSEDREALDQWLSQKVDDGWGSADHEPMWAWTESFVIFEGLWDGHTWFEVIPRHPTNDMRFAPRFVGGDATWF